MSEKRKPKTKPNQNQKQRKGNQLQVKQVRAMEKLHQQKAAH